MEPNQSVPPASNQPEQTVPPVAVDASTPQQQPPAQPAAPAPEPVAKANKLTLALSISSRSDISRCLREILRLDDYFHQASIRGGQAKDVPKISQSLESLAVANQLNMLRTEDRAALREFLTQLKTNAPVVHMSFPSEASGDFVMKLLEWFRREVHPHVVLHIGLQPELAAGCTVRTTNKVFDFSFRKRFEKSKQKLIAALEASA